MFSTITEAVEVYKADLRKFKQVMDSERKLMKEHKASQMTINDANLSHRLEGMQQVLGLTPDDIQKIYQEISNES